MDILARKNELVKGATDRNLEFPRYFESFTATDDIESLSKFVASRNIVTALGNNAHEYNFPNEIYWREEAIHAFGHLQFMQTLADGDSRLRFVPAAADAVVDIERKIDAFGSKTPTALPVRRTGRRGGTEWELETMRATRMATPTAVPAPPNRRGRRRRPSNGGASTIASRSATVFGSRGLGTGVRSTAMSW